MVGCAGVSDNDPAHEFSVERFRRLVDINLTGTFAVAQAVALEMQKASVDGSMVFTASMSGSVANKVRWSAFSKETLVLVLTHLIRASILRLIMPPNLASCN